MARMKTLLSAIILMVLASGPAFATCVGGAQGSAHTYSSLNTGEFQDGQAAASITQGCMRDFVASVVVNTPLIYAAAPPYNVVANGSTDQTANLQSALAAAATPGATVVLPQGVTIINGTGISIPAGVSLVGVNDARPYQGATTQGSVLSSPNASYASGTTPVVTLNGYNTLRWLTIEGAGSDGFGNGTSRPNIQAAAGASNLMDDVTSTNGYIGYNDNYFSQTFITNSRLGANQYGVQNLVDSSVSNTIFNSNGIDVNLGAGANHNRFTGNRFEFNGTGASIVIAGGFGWSATATTNGATAAGNAILHFASGPAAAIQGYLIYDQTNPTAIPFGTYVTTATPATTETMSANAIGGGVVNGDTILFYITQTQDNVFVGNQWDRSFLNAFNISYATGTVLNGNIFNRGGAGATANTSNDAEIQLFASSNTQIQGNTMRTGAADNGSGANSPSYGVWDGGANFNSMIKNNSIVYNKVNGTNGGGINSTTNFTTFLTDNAVTLASPYIIGQP